MRPGRHRGQGQRRSTTVSTGSGTSIPLPSGSYASPRWTLPTWLTHSTTTNKLTGEPFASINPDTYFTGTVHQCDTQAELTTALANCVDTDVILLIGNITITSTQTLRNRGDSGWVLITSDAFDATPLTNGVRFNPSTDSGLVRSLTSSSVHTVLRCAQSARGYFLRGIKITKDVAAANNGAALIDLGAQTQTSTSHVPTYIELRHCWITNPWTSSGPESRKGVHLQSWFTKIRDSYIDGHAEGGADSQAILISSTPGDFEIHNNYLEGGGENIMIGGISSSIGDTGICANGWIHQNYFIKRLSWNTGIIDGIVVRKNFYEMKVGQRVVWEGNVNENFDGTGQQFDMNFGCKPQNQPEEDGGALVVKDIWCRANLFKNSAAPMQIISASSDPPGSFGITDGTQRIQVNGNLWHAQGWPTGTNRPQFSVGLGLDNVVVENNTFKATSATVLFTPTPAGGGTDKAQGFIFQNNINFGSTGSVGPIFQDGGNQNSVALNNACTAGQWTCKNNVVLTRAWDATLANAPNNNKTASSLGNIGFVDQTNGDYTLTGGSLYKGTGTDGNDPGVDMAFLTTLTSGVVSGTPTG